MKKLSLIVPFSFLLLVACGGSGGSGESKSVSFDQKIDEVSEVLELSSPGSQEFDLAVSDLESMVQKGCVECTGFLAEIYWSESQYGSGEESYKWYWVDFATRQYSVEDFHNDSVVDELLEGIDSATASRLRQEAESWMSLNKVKF